MHKLLVRPARSLAEVATSRWGTKIGVHPCR